MPGLFSLPSEILLLAEFFVCFLFINLFFRVYGKIGLYVYTGLAVIVSNIQVLKLGSFSFVKEPVALGTVLFTSTFFVADILTERYGLKSSKKVIGISFLSMTFVPLVMGLTLSFKGHESHMYDNAIDILFSPIPRLMAASFISYGLCQLVDIHIFQTLKTATKGQFLGMRSLVSLVLSTFLDNILFCTLAWVVLAPQPISWHTLWYSYILGTYIIRLMATGLFAPCLYFFRKPS